MKRFAVSLAASVLTAGYWWGVFTIVYANILFGGDRSPDAVPPPDGDAMIYNGAMIAGAVLLYAGIILAWQLRRR